MCDNDRRVLLQFPLTTGIAARLIGTTEPKLSELVRRGRLEPPPPILAGRRLWSREHVTRAAKALGQANPEFLARLSEAEDA